MEEQICVVCSEKIDDLHLSSCQFCGGRFHQPWLTCGESPCGRMIDHSDALIVVFICDNCYQDGEY